MARCFGTLTPMNLSPSPYSPLPVLNQAKYPARFPCAACASSRFKAARAAPGFIAFFAIFGRLFRGSIVLTVMGSPRSEAIGSGQSFGSRFAAYPGAQVVDSGQEFFQNRGGVRFVISNHQIDGRPLASQRAAGNG